MSAENYFPKRIVCLTEESVEMLYLLGKEHLIVGVSAFVKRPVAAQKLPIVTTFTHANNQKILEVKPDLVLGFSDIQKDIAKELIAAGLNVFISNQRSIKEILNYLLWLGCMVGEKEQALSFILKFEQRIEDCKKEAHTFLHKPKVYFEEWPDPMITSIGWVSEMIEICGGQNIFREKSKESMAQGRIISESEVLDKNPDIIFACWCGKKVELDSFAKRDAWENINALKTNQVFELEPEVFLQPGPALFLDGLDILMNYFKQWQGVNK
ncbi:MAG: cobalamin-binding protein [Bacteriovoracaceae bacterium]|nr:cobalamin-binding protein [Bacteriovoracaceae bacterium]